MKDIEDIFKDMPYIKQGLDRFYGHQTVEKRFKEIIEYTRSLEKKSVSSFISSLDNKVFNTIRSSQDNAECRRVLREVESNK